MTERKIILHIIDTIYGIKYNEIGGIRYVQMG